MAVLSYICEHRYWDDGMHLEGLLVKASPLEPSSVQHFTCHPLLATFATTTDFFQTGVQRVAVATAANICRGLSTNPEHDDAVNTAAPILLGLLSYQVGGGGGLEHGDIRYGTGHVAWQARTAVRAIVAHPTCHAILALDVGCENRGSCMFGSDAHCTGVFA